MNKIQIMGLSMIILSFLILFGTLLVGNPTTTIIEGNCYDAHDNVIINQICNVEELSTETSISLMMGIFGFFIAMMGLLHEAAH